MAHIKSYRLILLTLGLLLILALSLFWNSLFISIISLQQELHSILRSHVADVAQKQAGGGTLLVLVAFAYGVFHAIGPGHGKAIVTTYLTTQSDIQVRQGMLLSFCGALLQSFCAIALVSIIVIVLHSSLTNFSYQEWLMEHVSYSLIILLGGLICWRNTQALLPKKQVIFDSPQISFQPVHATKAAQPFKPMVFTSSTEHHQGCSCQHHLTPSTGGWREQIPLLIAMGARPCTGALIVLTYAYIVKIYIYGLLAVIAMGIGTGCTVAGLAFLVMKLRNRILSWFPEVRNAKTHSMLISAIQLVGGITLIVMGALLLSATGLQPTKHPIL